jgi:uncharacterized protein
MHKVNFAWDEKKNKLNFRKHGVSFAFAQLAFKDKQRIIAEDMKHSKIEKRYYPKFGS